MKEPSVSSGFCLMMCEAPSSAVPGKRHLNIAFQLCTCAWRLSAFQNLKIPLIITSCASPEATSSLFILGCPILPGFSGWQSHPVSSQMLAVPDHTVLAMQNNPNFSIFSKVRSLALDVSLFPFPFSLSFPSFKIYNTLKSS